MIRNGFTRRAFLQTTSLGLAALSLPCSPLQADQPIGNRPNILFAFADDWSWRTVQKLIHT